ncbi:hypothetical protein [Streptomyces albipurpureus]|uniref:Nucleoside 2-deoxyribosyltransferase n=1 Tax=Streptomyces albipurpureus TaxID=2897419 RepID=A0ABT0UVQ4_9ACTN|nr:hypothetical protein [Streptomyces sp. CWNU-1]MCM2392674.1 hypothetical protein [Streptomyces sp. CWNU-1]
MPKYRIVSELSPGAEHREPRGADFSRDGDRLVTAIKATNLVAAVAKASEVLVGEHRGRRIVSVEEIHPGFAYSDEEISRALKRATRAGIPLIDPGDFEDDTTPFCESEEFNPTVQLVAIALRESGLVLGLDTSVLANEDDEPYVMVEVHDEARSVYFSRGTDVRRLTDDLEAAGWAGVLAVARALISFSNKLH